MAASDDTADSGPFGPLAGSKTALLTTYRPGGEAVATPLSIAVANGKVYFVTAGDSGKARRLADNPEATLAPCTVSGKVTGEAVEGRARRGSPATSAARPPRGCCGPPGGCSGAWSCTGCSRARRWSCTRSPRLGAHDDLQGPGTVDALDPVEFDVAGGAGAADPGLGPRGVEAGHRLRDASYHLG